MKNICWVLIFFSPFQRDLLSQVVVSGTYFIKDSFQIEVVDADAISMADINDDNKIDLIISSGKEGKTFLFEQLSNWKDWHKIEIFSIETVKKDVEGNSIGDINNDGKLEVVTLDQLNGNLYIHIFKESHRYGWETNIIVKGRPFLQDVMITDIDEDGINDILYTWQGNKKGTGGLNWLKYLGGDILNPDNWKDNALVIHEGAWWLNTVRCDLTGSGLKEEIIYSAKNSPNRNKASKPGLFWLQKGISKTNYWERHIIDTTLFRPSHVDIGNISGAGNGLDILVAGFQTNAINWYEYGANWEKHLIELPKIYGNKPDYIWNIKSINLNGHRDGIVAPIVNEKNRVGGLVLFAYAENDYHPIILKKINYSHPMDDRILLYDFTGDGLDELIIPDSGPGINAVHIFSLGKN